MAKFQLSNYQSAKRERAFSLYAEPDALGKRRTNTAIAQMVGASPSAIAYWKTKDTWDARLLATIDEELADAELTNRQIKKALRDGLHRHINTLSQIIADAKLPADRINAIKAFVHVAKELDCLVPDTGAADLASPPQFKDDIPHAPSVSPSEGPAGTDPSADGASGPARESPDPGDLPAALSADVSDPQSNGSPVEPGHADHLDGVFTKLGI
jgi:hypothetical protein